MTSAVTAWVASPTKTVPGARPPGAARGVHDVAHGRVVATGAQRPDQNLARVHPDAHLDVTTVGSLDFGERSLHAQGGPHGALGVVAVGDGRTEQGDDRVADDLVDAAAERDDVGHEELETAVDERLHLLGVELIPTATCNPRDRRKRQ